MNQDKIPNEQTIITAKELETALTHLKTPRINRKRPGPPRKGHSKKVDRRPGGRPPQAKAEPEPHTEEKAEEVKKSRRSRSRKPRGIPDLIIDLEKTKEYQDFLVLMGQGTCCVLDTPMRDTWDEGGIWESDLRKHDCHKIAKRYFKAAVDDVRVHVLRKFFQSGRWATSPQPFPLKNGDPQHKAGPVRTLRRPPIALYVYGKIQHVARSHGLGEVVNRRSEHYRILPLGVYNSMYEQEASMQAELASYNGNPPGSAVNPRPQPETVTAAAELSPEPEVVREAQTLPSKPPAHPPIPKAKEKKPGVFPVKVSLCYVCVTTGLQDGKPFEDTWEIEADSLEDAQIYAELCIDENEDFGACSEDVQLVGFVVKDAPVAV